LLSHPNNHTLSNQTDTTGATFFARRAPRFSTAVYSRPLLFDWQFSQSPRMLQWASYLTGNLMIEFRYTGEELWSRMQRAVERVDQRLRKTVQILESAGIPYAVVGGYAVRVWVAQVDEAAVRTTRDVDILIRPADLPEVIKAMTEAGFYHRKSADVDMFLEDPDGSARDAIHLVLCGQMVREGEFEPNPDIEPTEKTDDFQTISLPALVRMKLNAYRDKDRVHLRDMISLGMIDDAWVARYPAELGQRLQTLLDDPNG
jgi:hypothetical protein